MKDLRYTDLTVVKKIKTDEITWAHGNPTFIFTVEGTDLLASIINIRSLLHLRKTM